MPLSPQEQSALREFKRRCQDLLGNRLLSLSLFGSRARDEGHEESDLDVLVLVEEASVALRAKIFEISADVLLGYEVDISPLVMSQTHFEDMKRRERLLTREIEKDGHPL